MSTIGRALLRADLDAARGLLTAEPALCNAPLLDVKWRGRQHDGRQLHFAAQRDLYELAALLFELGADPRLTDARGATPLHDARSARMVELLVAAGADPRARSTASDDEPRASTITTARGFSRAFASVTARALVAAGARLQLADAVRLGWEREVDELLSAAPGRAIHRGSAPSLHAAAALGRRAEVERLARDPAHFIDEREARCGRTPLAWAVHSGSAETVDALLTLGADSSVEVAACGPLTRPDVFLDTHVLPDADYVELRQSVLALAVERSRFDLARRILERLVALDRVRASDGPARSVPIDRSAFEALAVSPAGEARAFLAELLAACRLDAQSCPELVSALRGLIAGTLPEDEVLARLALFEAAGAFELSGSGIDGTTALVDAEGRSVLAVQNPARVPASVASRLRALGAPVDLAIAVGHGWAELVRELDVPGALPAKARQALLWNATRAGRAEVLAGLLERTSAADPVDLRKVIDSVTSTGDLALLRVLVERGDLTWEHVTQNGDTLLHRGAESAELVSFLLARGMDPDMRGSSDETPLHAASKACALDSMRVLLAAGAAVDARDNRGDTPLLSLFGGSGYRYGLVAAAELLLEAGADPLAIGTSGPRAIEEARWSVEDPLKRAALRAQFARCLTHAAPRGLLDELFRH